MKITQIFSFFLSNVFLHAHRHATERFLFYNQSSKGQTTIDYTIGITLFIGVIGGVYLLLPTIFDPLSSSATANAILSDQIATQLTTELLNAEQPGTLDAVCTTVFFSQNTSLDGDCSFTADDSIETIIGVDRDTDVAITVRELSTESEPVGTTQIDGVTYDLQRQTSEQRQNTAVSTRTVRINGELHRVTVEVW